MPRRSFLLTTATSTTRAPALERGARHVSSAATICRDAGGAAAPALHAAGDRLRRRAEFSATWAAWRDDHSARGTSISISTKDTVCRHRSGDDPSRLSEFAALSAMLLAQWPTLTRAGTACDFADRQLTLDLLFGDAAELNLPIERDLVDAYFSIGFAPARATRRCGATACSRR